MCVNTFGVETNLILAKANGIYIIIPRQCAQGSLDKLGSDIEIGGIAYMNFRQ